MKSAAFVLLLPFLALSTGLGCSGNADIGEKSNGAGGGGAIATGGTMTLGGAIEIGGVIALGGVFATGGESRTTTVPPYCGDGSINQDGE